jgi:DeoR/GlpR family transcriptional regulator of sugar metabolism
VIVVADSSKLGRAAFARICSVGEIDELITDEGAAPDQLAALAEAGVRVSKV